MQRVSERAGVTVDDLKLLSKASFADLLTELGGYNIALRAKLKAKHEEL
jgi:hypothetical protein